MLILSTLSAISPVWWTLCSRGDVQVVYGTRIFGMNTVYQSFRHTLGNRMTTLVANLLYDSCISDLHTCLKLLPVPLMRSLNLRERGFGLDSEITAELLRRGYRPFEVPVSYVSRSPAQGKKLTWRDGVHSLRVLASVRLRPKAYPPGQGLGAFARACGLSLLRSLRSSRAASFSSGSNAVRERVTLECIDQVRSRNAAVKAPPAEEPKVPLRLQFCGPIGPTNGNARRR